jgi:lipopolysaccharide biosynthesis glycosyltransferase
MNIFISADDKYTHPAQVMLTSFFINNNSEKHTVYFLHNNTQQSNIVKLENIVKRFNSNFVPVQITMESFKNFIATERFPVNIYYRLTIPSLLPETEKRALWLDVDLVVNDSLENFYYQDFEEKAFVACKDIENREEHLKKLGLSPNIDYINSGVILFNLPVMRKYTLNDYYNFFNSHKDVIVWPDQDILNGVFANKIKVLDNDIYNVQVSNWRFKGGIDLTKSTIIHYIGNNKPWFKEYTNSAAANWDKYHALTFNKGNFYILSQKIHRKIEKIILAPFRTFITETYNKSDVLKKIRQKFKQNI